MCDDAAFKVAPSTTSKRTRKLDCLFERGHVVANVLTWMLVMDGFKGGWYVTPDNGKDLEISEPGNSGGDAIFW